MGLEYTVEEEGEEEEEGGDRFKSEWISGLNTKVCHQYERSSLN